MIARIQKLLLPASAGVLLGVIAAWGWMTLLQYEYNRTSRSNGKAQIPYSAIGNSDIIMGQLGPLGGIYTIQGTIHRVKDSPDEVTLHLHRANGSRRSGGTFIVSGIPGISSDSGSQKWPTGTEVTLVGYEVGTVERGYPQSMNVRFIVTQIVEPKDLALAHKAQKD